MAGKHVQYSIDADINLNKLIASLAKAQSRAEKFDNVMSSIGDRGNLNKLIDEYVSFEDTILGLRDSAEKLKASLGKSVEGGFIASLDQMFDKLAKISSKSKDIFSGIGNLNLKSSNAPKQLKEYAKQLNELLDFTGIDQKIDLDLFDKKSIESQYDEVLKFVKGLNKELSLNIGKIVKGAGEIDTGESGVALKGFLDTIDKQIDGLKARKSELSSQIKEMQKETNRAMKNFDISDWSSKDFEQFEKIEGEYKSAKIAMEKFVEAGDTSSVEYKASVDRYAQAAKQYVGVTETLSKAIDNMELVATKEDKNKISGRLFSDEYFDAENYLRSIGIDKEAIKKEIGEIDSVISSLGKAKIKETSTPTTFISSIVKRYSELIEMQKEFVGGSVAYDAVNDSLESILRTLSSITGQSNAVVGDLLQPIIDNGSAGIKVVKDQIRDAMRADQSSQQAAVTAQIEESNEALLKMANNYKNAQEKIEGLKAEASELEEKLQGVSNSSIDPSKFKQATEEVSRLKEELDDAYRHIKTLTDNLTLERGANEYLQDALSEVDSRLYDAEQKAERLKKELEETKQVMSGMSIGGDGDGVGGGKVVSQIQDLTQEAEKADKVVTNLLYHIGNLLSGSGGKADTFKDTIYNLSEAVYDEEMRQYGYGMLGGGLFGVTDPSKLEYGTDSNSRFIHSIDLSKYNMYMADTEERAIALIDFLSKLQQFCVRTVVPDYTKFDDRLINVDTESLFAQSQALFEQSELTKDKFNSFITDMCNLLRQAGLTFDADVDSLNFDSISDELSSSDNISTRFLRMLGYDGVNVGQTSFDSFAQGSVLFDFDKSDIVGYFASIEEAINDYKRTIAEIGDGNQWRGFTEQLQQQKQNIDEIIQRLSAYKNEQSELFPNFSSSKYASDINNAIDELTRIKDTIDNTLSKSSNDAAGSGIGGGIGDASKREVEELEGVITSLREEIATYKSQIQDLDSQLSTAHTRGEFEALEETLRQVYKEYDDASRALEEAKNKMEYMGYGDVTYSMYDSVQEELDEVGKELDEVKKKYNAVQLLFEDGLIGQSGVKELDFSPVVDELTTLKNVIIEIRDALKPFSEALNTDGTAFKQMATVGGASLDSLVEKLQDVLALTEQINSKEFTNTYNFNQQNSGFEAFRQKKTDALALYEQFNELQKMTTVMTHNKGMLSQLKTLDEYRTKYSAVVATMSNLYQDGDFYKLEGKLNKGKSADLDIVISQLKEYIKIYSEFVNLQNKINPGSVDMSKYVSTGVGQATKDISQQMPDVTGVMQAMQDGVSKTSASTIENINNLRAEIKETIDNIQVDLQSIVSFDSIQPNYSNVQNIADNIYSIFSDLKTKIDALDILTVDGKVKIDTGNKKDAEHDVDISAEDKKVLDTGSAFELATEAKNGFVQANAQVQQSVKTSADALETEINKVLDVGTAFDIATQAKKDFVAANAEVAGAAKVSADAIKEEAEQVKKQSSKKKESDKKDDSDFKDSDTYKRLENMSSALDDNIKKLIPKGTVKIEDDAIKNIKDNYDELIGTIQNLKKEQKDIDAGTLDELEAKAHNLSEAMKDYHESLKKYNAQSDKFKLLNVAFNDLDANYNKDAASAQAMNQYKQSYENMVALQHKFANSSDLTTQETRELAEEFQKAVKDCDTYSKALEKAMRTFDKMQSGAYGVHSTSDSFNFGDFNQRKSEMMSYIDTLDGVDKATIKWGADAKSVTFTMVDSNKQIHKMKAAFTDVGDAIILTSKQSERARGILAKTFDGLGSGMQRVLAYVSSFTSFYEVINVLRQGITYVKEIDSALTELKKVTDETDATYNRFLENMSKTASVVGSTVKDLTIMAAEWARLGYNIQDSARLAESTAVLLNVSEFKDATEASEALISTMQAFQYTADESLHVVDILNEVGKIVARR